MSEGSGFFDELKRRHVWRVAVAYAIVGWLVVQLASILFPTFGTPAWVLKTVVALLAIGFPVALVLAWAYELTPTGIRRTVPADSPEARAEHDSRAIGRKLNTTVIVVLVLAVALLLGNQFLWHKGMRATTGAAQAPTSAANPARSPDTAQRTAFAGLQTRTAKPARRVSDMDVANNPGTIPPDSVAGAAASGQSAITSAGIPAPATSIPQKSVAVLPFANQGDKDDQYFSDGLSEDLINALSQFDGLKVISRNSAFQFRGSKDSAAEIGAKLGVAHLLEGSVRRQEDEVRISAALVKASDGTIVWSRQYDRPYQDLFALQDAITEAVAGALKAKLLIAPGAVVQSDRPPGANLDAYTAYLRGMGDGRLDTEQGSRDAITAYGEAIRLDSNYAAANARLSIAWRGLAQQYLGGAAMQQAYVKARAAARTALALDSDCALAHLARAGLLLYADMNWAGAEVEARRARQLAPNDANAKFFLGKVLATLGNVERAAELTRQSLRADPRHAKRYYWQSVYLAALGQLDEAAQAARTALALQPGTSISGEQLAIVEIVRGNPEAALVATQRGSPGIWRDVARTLVLQMGSDHAAADAALKKLIADHSSTSAYQIAEVYALRGDADDTFQWLDRAWIARDPGIGYLLMDPLILRYRDDPRFAAFAKKVGLPTTTDAVAMK